MTSKKQLSALLMSAVLASSTFLVPVVMADTVNGSCLLYTSPSPRDRQKSRMPSSA